MKNTIVRTLTTAALLAVPFAAKAEPASSAVVANSHVVDKRVDLDIANFLTTETVYTVPAGKKLVIERVEFHGRSRTSPAAEVLSVQLNSGTSNKTFPVVLRAADSSSPQQRKLSQRLEAESGTDVQIKLKRLSTDRLTGYVGLKGYLVDMP